MIISSDAPRNADNGATRPDTDFKPYRTSAPPLPQCHPDRGDPQANAAIWMRHPRFAVTVGHVII
jgi:hypothetical protein